MKILGILVIAFLVGGCAAPAVIADLETDKVIVQSRLGTSPEDIAAKAREGCALHGRTAVPISKQCLDNYCISANHLFACKERR